MFSKVKGKYNRVMSRLAHIKSESHKNYVILLCKFFLLKREKGISFHEFYVYEFEKQTEQFKNTFLGDTLKRTILDLLNPEEYRITSKNKYLTHKVLSSMGIRTSELYLYYNPLIDVSNENIAQNYKDVCNIINNKGIKECVVKPTDRTHGEGVVLYKNIRIIDEKCYLVSYDGKELELESILNDEPLIFEEYIEQTEQFKLFNPTSVNTIRFITTLYPSGECEIVSAIIKIGRNGVFVDNAGNGTSSNIMGAVDVKTGQIKNVFEFNGWRKFHSIKYHPDSGELLDGVFIENWENIKDTVKEFQKSHPFLKAIGWDIAITPKGAVVVETNSFWDLTFQYILEKGWKEELLSCYEAWSK